MIAVLDESEFDIVGAEPFDKIERVAPRHVGVAHALQDADREIERKRALADQVLAPLLDQSLGDGIRVAIERGLVDDAIARERGFRRFGHLVPHQPLGHVPGGRDQNEARELCQRPLARELAGEQKRDPSAHRRADHNRARRLGKEKLEHGGGLRRANRRSRL